MKTIRSGDCSITFDDSQEAKEKLFDAIIKFATEQKCFSGETFSQCDWPQVAAMSMMPEILDDILKFDATYD
jgi:hypothetical protein